MRVKKLKPDGESVFDQTKEEAYSDFFSSLRCCEEEMDRRRDKNIQDFFYKLSSNDNFSEDLKDLWNTSGLLQDEDDY